MCLSPYPDRLYTSNLVVTLCDVLPCLFVLPCCQDYIYCISLRSLFLSLFLGLCLSNLVVWMWCNQQMVLFIAVVDILLMVFRIWLSKNVSLIICVILVHFVASMATIFPWIAIIACLGHSGIFICKSFVASAYQWFVRAIARHFHARS